MKVGQRRGRRDVTAHMTPMSRDGEGRGVGKGTNAVTTRVCALASALLISTLMSALGCVNPLFFDDVAAAANHAPVVANMRPSPSFDRLELNVGTNCAPLFTFFPDFIDDADLDVLSVRWTLLLDASGVIGGVRVELRDEELVPLEEPVDNAFYAFTPFQVTREVLEVKLVPFDEQAADPNIEGQLLELTVSDRGFKPGDGAVPSDGAGTFYLSWAVRLTNVPCEAGL